MIATLCLTLLTCLTPDPAPQEAEGVARTVPLSRGWRVGLFDEGGELLARRRVVLPLPAPGPGARAVYERTLGLSDAEADLYPWLRVEAPWLVDRVELDGEVLPRTGERAALFDLGDRLADGEGHKLEVHVTVDGGASGSGEPGNSEPGIWGDIELLLVPRVGLAREDESRVGPLTSWSWVEPDRAELVVRTELVARGRSAGPMGVEARLASPGGAELAADVDADLTLRPDGRREVTLRLRPSTLPRWTPNSPRLLRLRLNAYESGRVVDTFDVPVIATRFGLDEQGRPVDRASGRPLRVAEYTVGSLGGVPLAGDASLRRDLARLRSVGFEAVVALGPHGHWLEGGDADFERAAWEAGLWVAPREAVSRVVALPHVARGDGDRRLADHAQLVAEALARGWDLPPFDAERVGPGLLDEFRRPKFAYRAAQAAAGEAVVYPATFWNADSFAGPLDVYTGGDEVELFVDGESLGRRPVGADGAPPFAARFPDVQRGSGELLAVAYVDGSRLSERVLAAPAPATQIVLQADELGVGLELPDTICVHALALDGEGRLQAGFEGTVTFSLYGGVEPASATEVRFEAGVASLLVRSSDDRGGSLSASVGSLRSEPIVLRGTELVTPR